MLLQICEFLRTPFLKTAYNFVPANVQLFSSKRNSIATFRRLSELACYSFKADDIARVLHNKVLVAAGLSAAIGQLCKPFTSSLLYGKKFDIKAAVQTGGFPSTHSSDVVATATSLALERGFSDPVFGLTVVYAGLVMYDAQGVRREVGTHAKEINKVLQRTTSYSTSSENDSETDSFSRDSSSNFENIDPLLSEDLNKNAEYSCSPLKESIGHTEIEVAAGALLGFLVSLAICPYV